MGEEKVITNVNSSLKFKVINYIVTDNIEDTELTKFILDKIDNIKLQFPNLGIVANVLDKAKKRSVYYIDTVTSKKLGLDTIIGSDIFDEIDKNHSGQGSVNLEKLKELVNSEIQEKIKAVIQDLKVLKDQIQSFELKLSQGQGGTTEITLKEYFLDTSRLLNSSDLNSKLDVEKFDTFKEKTLKDILDTNNKLNLLQTEINKIDTIIDTKVNAKLQTDGIDSKISTKVNELLNSAKAQIKQELTTELVKEFAKLIPNSSGSSGSGTPGITEQRVNEIIQAKLTELSSSLNIDKVVQDKINLIKDLLIQNIEQKAEAKVQEVLNASIDQKIDDRVEVKTSAISQNLDSKLDGKINDKLNVKTVEIYNTIDTKINDKLAVKLIKI